jgi:Co/Zn/Cd efflux system component
LIGLAVVLQRCNVIVVFAALRFGSASAWPDPAVTAVMAFIFLTSSMQILQQAWSEYFQQRVSASVPQPALGWRTAFVFPDPYGCL